MEGPKLTTPNTTDETSHFLWKVVISLPYLQERVASPFLKEHESSTSHPSLSL